jgi:hypothetical protein
VFWFATANKDDPLSERPVRISLRTGRSLSSPDNQAAGVTPVTCFVCGRDLDPDEYYVPIQGWLPADSDDPDDLEEVERADDCGFCPECVWEIETGTRAVPPPSSPE